MNQEIIKGYWHEIKGKLKQKWGKLTDDDILQMEGSYEEIEGILEKTYGYQKEEAAREIQQFLDENNWKKD